MQLAIISILLSWKTLCSVILIICKRIIHRAGSGARFCFYLCWQQMVGSEPQPLCPRAKAETGEDSAELLRDKEPSPQPQWERVAVKDQEPHRRAPSACKVQL